MSLQIESIDVGYLYIKTESLIFSWQSLKNGCVAVAKEYFKEEKHSTLFGF